ncbi:hypothetical protein DIPPA_30229 [Diplonema papillatum]|nr:hypothetical protein DIPPA_30229 [Diplonema papillatum]
MFLRRTGIRWVTGGQPPPYWNPMDGPYLPPPKMEKMPFEYIRKPPINKGICIVPQGELWVVERFGKFHTAMEPGLTFLIPFIDRIGYVHSSKEQAHEIPNQSAITKDNVVVNIDGILFFRIMDARKASYNIDNPIYNLINVAQTTMRSEIGKLTLDKLFEERAALNSNIKSVISVDAEEWGIVCKRYEIRDIQVSSIVRNSMDLQAQADRQRRKVVVESEGERDAMTNRALGEKRAKELMAEAEKVSIVKEAEAAAESARIRAEAQATAIQLVSDAIRDNSNSSQAINFDVAKKYIDSFGKIAKECNTVVLPSNLQDPSAMVASAMAVYSNINKRHSGGAAGPPPASAGGDAGSRGAGSARAAFGGDEGALFGGYPDSYSANLAPPPPPIETPYIGGQN